MRNILKVSILFAVTLMAFTACEDPENGPLFIYSDLEGGSYIRLVETTGNTLVDLDDFTNYSYSYTVDFVDAEDGGLVESYSVDLIYSDKSTGSKTTVTDFRTFQASDFSVNEAGFTQSPQITFTSQQLVDAFSLNEADLGPEDEFQLAGEITLTNGRVFNSGNSSATVEGAFFQGFFDFNLFVGCESNLDGEYSATSTAINCSTGVAGSASVTSTVKIASTGKIAIGEYGISDWSFGVLEDCFGNDNKDDGEEFQGGFLFEEVCGVVTFSAVTDEFGTIWDYTSTISGNEWTITWMNPDSGLGATSVVTFPEGIPFTVN